MKYITRLGIAIIVLVSCYIAGSCIKNYLDYKEANRENNAYVDYICENGQLTCINAGDKVGRMEVEIDGKTYNCSYQEVVGASDEEFVFAYIYQTGFFPTVNDYYVLQSPNSDVDVLRDWTIAKIDLCYINTNGASNKTEKDMKVNSLAAISDASILQEVSDVLQKNKYETSNNEFESITQEIPKDIFSLNGVDGMECYLRVHFKELESLVYDIPIEIYSSETSASEYVIYLDKLIMEQLDDIEYERIYLNEKSSLFKTILDTYTPLFNKDKNNK